VVHENAADMRAALKRIGHKNPSKTLAACWQLSRITKGSDGNLLIAEIHFCKEHLDTETILHESVHAAWHRATISGIPLTHEKFEEWVATDSGVLAVLISNWITSRDEHKRTNP
jgi:hypothetical protein